MLTNQEPTTLTEDKPAELPPKVAQRMTGNFAEMALRLSGKEEDEVRRTGAIDQADDEVETLYSPQYQTSNSPVHRAVWTMRSRGTCSNRSPRRRMPSRNS